MVFFVSAFIPSNLEPQVFKLKTNNVGFCYSSYFVFVMEVNYEVILKAVKIVFFRTLCVDKSGDFLKQAENEYQLIKQVQVQIVNCIAT